MRRLSSLEHTALAETLPLTCRKRTPAARTYILAAVAASAGKARCVADAPGMARAASAGAACRGGEEHLCRCCPSTPAADPIPLPLLLACWWRAILTIAPASILSRFGHADSRTWTLGGTPLTWAAFQRLHRPYLLSSTAATRSTLPLPLP